MTIREMITALETLAQQHGEDTRVTVYDYTTEAEGWDYTQEGLYLDAEPSFDEEMGVIRID
jgi:hypothetical protein